jgi:5-methylcytosine-specific restriction endonuclease McrA
VSSPHLSETSKREIHQRANHLCEYCHTSEWWQSVPFTIDHVIPISLGGSNDLENLALACLTCNIQKSNKIEATDPETGIDVPLFNPRQESWSSHFVWSTDRLVIIGLTEIGRATVMALKMNRDRVLRIRSADLAVNRHPPKDDPIQILE